MRNEMVLKSAAARQSTVGSGACFWPVDRISTHSEGRETCKDVYACSTDAFLKIDFNSASRPRKFDP